MARSLTYDEVKAANPCSDSFCRVAKILGGKDGWNGNRISAADARAAGCTFDDIVWIASAIAKTDADVERRLRLWMADCAARVLHIYEKTETSEAPRNAIIAARQFARGEIDAAAWSHARAAARAAAGAHARDPAARAAVWSHARAAASAAAWSHAWAAAAMAAAWSHARAAARDAAWAAHARDAEEAWQFNRLIARLSDDEPEDVTLPERALSRARGE